MRTFVSRNIFHVHLNIMICTSRILRRQKGTFGQIYSKFYINKALVYDLWPQTSEPTAGKHGYSRPRIIIQNNRNIHCAPANVQLKLWKHCLVAPQAAGTELLVAGLAQWVCLECNRWQEKSLHCVQGWGSVYDILPVLCQALTVSMPVVRSVSNFVVCFLVLLSCVRVFPKITMQENVSSCCVSRCSDFSISHRMFC